MEAGSGDEAEDGPQYHHPDPPTQRVASPVRAENKTDQPPPDSGASRRQLSPAPGKPHQLPPPALDSARPPPPWLSALGRAPPPRLPGPGRLCRPLERGYSAALAQRALDDANQVTLRRGARRRRFDEDIEQAMTAGREASLVVERAQQAFAQSAASAATGATAAPSPSTRPQGVAS